MKIFVQVKADAKENKVEGMGSGHYRVRVKAPPIEGKANEALVAVLAEYFDVPKRTVRLCSGQTSKKKIFEVG